MGKLEKDLILNHYCESSSILFTGFSQKLWKNGGPPRNIRPRFATPKNSEKFSANHLPGNPQVIRTIDFFGSSVYHRFGKTVFS